MTTAVVKPCKRCGDERPANTLCGRCGGHGLIHGYEGEPLDCPECGCSGIQFPPRCPGCGAWRSWTEGGAS